MNWNDDFAAAPKGCVRMISGKAGCTRAIPEKEWIFAVGHDGAVSRTYWVADQARWNGFTAKHPPVAWLKIPTHPLIEKAISEAAMSQKTTDTQGDRR